MRVPCYDTNQEITEQTSTEDEASEDKDTTPDNDIADDEFADLPPLEEPDQITTMPSFSNDTVGITEEGADIPTSYSEETPTESNIIEINAPSSEPASIFSKQKETVKSRDIFANIVSDDSEGSDNEEDAAETSFFIEEVSTLNNEDVGGCTKINKPIIEEVSNSNNKNEENNATINKPNIEEVHSSSITPQLSEPTRESLPEPDAVPKKNPFLITEVQSSDISDMFSTQDALLCDDVEQMYVGDAHEEAQDSVKMVPPGAGGQDFLSKLGSVFGDNSRARG